MKEKKFFEEPEIEVIKFSAQDIIATSGEDFDNEFKPTTDTEDFDINF